jgi:hypothetical protein
MKTFMLAVSVSILLCGGALTMVASPSDSSGRMVVNEGTSFRVIGISPALAPGEQASSPYQKLILTSRYNVTVIVNGEPVEISADSLVVLNVTDASPITIDGGRSPFSIYTYQDLYGNGEMACHVPFHPRSTEFFPFSWWQDAYSVEGTARTTVGAKTYVLPLTSAETVVSITRSGITQDTTLGIDEYLEIDEPIMENGTRNSSTDPTGYSITASSPISVVSGHPKAAVLRYPDGLPYTGPYARPASRSRGNLHDAMLPSVFAGGTFVTVPLLYTPTRIRGLDMTDQGIEDDRGDVVRFIGLHDSTRIYKLTSTDTVLIDTILGRGDTWYSSRVEVPTVWITSRPVLCAQYGKSYGRITSQATDPADDPSVDAGQPLLQVVPNVERWTDHSVFLSPEETSNFLNVACRADDANSILVDGRSIGSVLRRHDISGTPYTTFSGLISSGRHIITTTSSQARFGAWTYGSLDGLQLGKIYGSMTGMNYAVDCDDSLFVDVTVIDQDSVRITYRAEPQELPCADIAYAVVERIIGGTYRSSGSMIMIHRDSTFAVDGTVLVVTRSGRFLRRSFHLDGTTSVQEERPFTASIRPNPVLDICRIARADTQLLSGTVEILSVLGVKMMSFDVRDVQELVVDVQSLPPGAYIVTGAGLNGMFLRP